MLNSLRRRGLHQEAAVFAVQAITLLSDEVGYIRHDSIPPGSGNRYRASLRVWLIDAQGGSCPPFARSVLMMLTDYERCAR
jgi:hypothetical protein